MANDKIIDTPQTPVFAEPETKQPVFADDPIKSTGPVFADGQGNLSQPVFADGPAEVVVPEIELFDKNSQQKLIGEFLYENENTTEEDFKRNVLATHYSNIDGVKYTSDAELIPRIKADFGTEEISEAYDSKMAQYQVKDLLGSIDVEIESEEFQTRFGLTTEELYLDTEKASAVDIAKGGAAAFVESVGSMAKVTLSTFMKYAMGPEPSTIPTFRAKTLQESADIQQAMLDEGFYNQDDIIMTLGSDIKSKIQNLSPESFKESRELMQRESSRPLSGNVLDKTIQFAKTGLIMVTDNAPNLVAGMVNPQLAFTMMVSSEKESVYDMMIEANIDRDIAEEYSGYYGLTGGVIEYIETVGRLRASGLKQPVKQIKKTTIKKIIDVLTQAGINVGEELLQAEADVFFYNLALEKQKERNPNFEGERRDQFSFEEMKGTAKGSLAMSAVLDAFGLSTRGIKNAIDVKKVKKQKRGLLMSLEIPTDIKAKAAKGLDGVSTPSEFKAWFEELVIDLQNSDESVEDKQSGIGRVSPVEYELKLAGLEDLDSLASEILVNEKEIEKFNAELKDDLIARNLISQTINTKTDKGYSVLDLFKAFFDAQDNYDSNGNLKPEDLSVAKQVEMFLLTKNEDNINFLMEYIAEFEETWDGDTLKTKDYGDVEHSASLQYIATLYEIHSKATIESLKDATSIIDIEKMDPILRENSRTLARKFRSVMGSINIGADLLFTLDLSNEAIHTLVDEFENVTDIKSYREWYNSVRDLINQNKNNVTIDNIDPHTGRSIEDTLIAFIASVKTETGINMELNILLAMRENNIEALDNIKAQIEEFTKTWDGQMPVKRTDVKRSIGLQEFVAEYLFDSQKFNDLISASVSLVTKPMTQGEFKALGETRNDLIRFLEYIDADVAKILLSATGGNAAAQKAWNNITNTLRIRSKVETSGIESLTKAEKETYIKQKRDDYEKALNPNKDLREVDKQAKTFNPEHYDPEAALGFWRRLQSWANPLDAIVAIAPKLANRLSRYEVNHKTYYNEFFEKGAGKIGGQDLKRQLLSFNRIETLISALDKKGVLPSANKFSKNWDASLAGFYNTGDFKKLAMNVVSRISTALNQPDTVVSKGIKKALIHEFNILNPDSKISATTTDKQFAKLILDAMSGEMKAFETLGDLYAETIGAKDIERSQAKLDYILAKVAIRKEKLRDKLKAKKDKLKSDLDNLDKKQKEDLAKIDPKSVKDEFDKVEPEIDQTKINTAQAKLKDFKPTKKPELKDVDTEEIVEFDEWPPELDQTKIDAKTKDYKPLAKPKMLKTDVKDATKKRANIKVNKDLLVEWEINNTNREEAHNEKQIVEVAKLIEAHEKRVEAFEARKKAHQKKRDAAPAKNKEIAKENKRHLDDWKSKNKIRFQKLEKSVNTTIENVNKAFDKKVETWNTSKENFKIALQNKKDIIENKYADTLVKYTSKKQGIKSESKEVIGIIEAQIQEFEDTIKAIQHKKIEDIDFGKLDEYTQKVVEEAYYQYDEARLFRPLVRPQKKIKYRKKLFGKSDPNIVDVALGKVDTPEAGRIEADDIEMYFGVSETIEKALRAVATDRAKAELFDNKDIGVTTKDESGHSEQTITPSDLKGLSAELNNLSEKQLTWLSETLSEIFDEGKGTSDSIRKWKTLVLPLISMPSTAVKQFGDITKMIYRIKKIVGLSKSFTITGKALKNAMFTPTKGELNEEWDGFIGKRINIGSIGAEVVDIDLPAEEVTSSYKEYKDTMFEEMVYEIRGSELGWLTKGIPTPKELHEWIKGGKPSIALQHFWKKGSLILLRVTDTKMKNAYLEGSIEALRSVDETKRIEVLTDMLRGDIDLAMKVSTDLMNRNLNEDSRLALFNIMNVLHPLSALDRAPMFRKYRALGIYKSFSTKLVGVFYQMLSKPMTEAKRYGELGYVYNMKKKVAEKKVADLQSKIEAETNQGSIESLEEILVTEKAELNKVTKQRAYAVKKEYGNYFSATWSLVEFAIYFVLLDSLISTGLSALRTRYRDEEEEEETFEEQFGSEIIENLANIVTPIANLGNLVHRRGWGNPIEKVMDDIISMPIPLQSTADAIYKALKNEDPSELKAITKEIPLFGTMFYNTIKYFDED